MTLYSFTSGERIKIGAVIYNLRRKISDGTWQLENEKNGQYLQMDEAQLRQQYNDNRISFVTSYKSNEGCLDEVADEKMLRSFGDYPESLQHEAQRRLKYIRAWQHSEFTNPLDALIRQAKELGEAKPPAVSTILKWSRKLKSSSGDIRSLVPCDSSKGNQQPRFCQEVTEIALNEIRRIYMTLERRSAVETLSSIRNVIERENLGRSESMKLVKPSRKFLQNLIDKIDKYEIMRSRYGKRAADVHFRQALVSGETISEPLERVEIDHTTLDLIVVSADTYLPLGRPTLTVAIDRCTRCLLGYHIGFDPPSYVSIMKCLSHAIKPKDYIAAQYRQIQNPWPCWGIPKLVVCDNGRDFHSKDLETAALSLLIDLRFNPVRQPWWKGAVERFFRNLSKSLIHTVPGTTFSNIAEKADYKSTKHAIVTEESLHELMHAWICDIYHQEKNNSTLRTPASLWLERISSTCQTLPESVEMLDINLSSVVWRKVCHYGVSLNSLNYNSQELQNLRRRKNDVPVQLRWDQSNLGQIHILDEDANNYLRVPCTWRSYAEGLSLWLHRQIRKEAESIDGRENQAKLDAAKERIRVIYEKAMHSKKIETRKKAARASKCLNMEPTGQILVSVSSDGASEEYSVRAIAELTSPVSTYNIDDIPDYEIKERSAL